MISINVNTSDIKRYMNRISKFEGDLRYMTNDLAHEGGEVYASAIRKNTPVATGALKASITSRAVNRNTWEITAGNGLGREYAKFQAYGYKGHDIKSIWLHTKAGYSMPDSKFVHVSKSTPFMDLGLQEFAPWLDNQLKRRMFSATTKI